MTAAASDLDEMRLYTLGQASHRSGMFGLPMRATIVAAVALVLALLVSMTNGLLSGAGIAVLAALYLIPAVVRLGHRTLYEVLSMRVQFFWSKVKGQTVYRSGPTSRVPGGRFRLPGFLSRSELHVGLDIAGNEFGMIRDPALNQYTVLISCAPHGAEPWTLADRNIMTREWGMWLADLSLSGDVVAATATIETAPATGQDLMASVLESVNESSPEIARRIQAEAAAQFTRNQQSIRGWASITFKAATAMQRKDPEAMATEIGQRLPGLYSTLGYAGVSARPMSPADVVGRALAAYRPEVDEAVVGAQVVGEDLGVEWEDAGPATAVTGWSNYRHSEFVSKTFEMGLPPQAAFPDTVLAPLLGPHPDLPRKRVTMIYRPFPAGEGVKKVEAENNDAINAAASGKKLKGAGAGVRLEQTESARQALARGAQLGTYSLMVTITLPEVDTMAAGSAILTQLGNRSQVRLEPANGQQDAAFQAGLGMGVYLHQRSTIGSWAKAG